MPMPTEDDDAYQPDLFQERWVPLDGPLTVELRWVPSLRSVEAHWPELRLTSWFTDWPHAMRVVLVEQNAHVRVKVKA